MTEKPLIPRRETAEEINLRIYAERAAEAKANGNDGNAQTAKTKKTKPKKVSARKPTQAEVLIKVALADCESLFHTPDGVAYAQVDVGWHREVWALNSRGFNRWLKRAYYNETEGSPNSDAMAQAKGILEAMAHFDGETHEVYLRIANLGDKIYLDLCDEEWRVVEITRDRWQILDESPVYFRRKRGMQRIPDPVYDADIRTLGGLNKHLNVKGEGLVLVVSWLLAILYGKGPYPILGLSGEQGSAKTFAANLLKRLLDPQSAGVRGPPKDSHDLYVAAMNSHILVFDNLSGISAEISDCLCRLSTGGGFATRTLYSDDDETTFDGQRPVCITAINDVLTRGDLADRTIMVQLDTIPEADRKLERHLYKAFDDARPEILGALLDVVSYGLLNLPHTSMNRLPRMADFAIWVRSCEEAMWSAGSFMGAYEANRDDAAEIVVESDELAATLKDYLHRWLTFEGTATQLLAGLNTVASEQTKRSKFWPRTPKCLSGRLNRLTPALRKTGMTIEHSRVPGKGTRIVTIRQNAEEAA